MLSCLSCLSPKYDGDAPPNGTVAFSRRHGAHPSEGKAVEDLAQQVLSRPLPTGKATSKNVTPLSNVSPAAADLREVLAGLTRKALEQQAEHNVKEDKFNRARKVLAEKLGGEVVTGFVLTGAPKIKQGPGSYSSIRDAFAAGNEGASSQESSAPTSPREINDKDPYVGSSVVERIAFLNKIGAQSLYGNEY